MCLRACVCACLCLCCGWLPWLCDRSVGRFFVGGCVFVCLLLLLLLLCVMCVAVLVLLRLHYNIAAARFFLHIYII